MKHLIKKFSLREIEKEILSHAWELPSSEEVRNADIEYRVVWVSDLPSNEEDRETHGCIYDRKNDIVEVCNKSFKWNIVVKEV